MTIECKSTLHSHRTDHEKLVADLRTSVFSQNFYPLLSKIQKMATRQASPKHKIHEQDKFLNFERSEEGQEATESNGRTGDTMLVDEGLNGLGSMLVEDWKWLEVNNGGVDLSYMSGGDAEELSGRERPAEGLARSGEYISYKSGEWSEDRFEEDERSVDVNGQLGTPEEGFSPWLSPPTFSGGERDEKNEMRNEGNEVDNKLANRTHMSHEPLRPTNDLYPSATLPNSVRPSQTGQYKQYAVQTYRELPNTPMTSGSGSGSTPGGSQSSQDDRLPCNRCTKTFKREGDLRRHYKKHFRSQYIFECFVGNCTRNGGKGFYRRDKWADHQKKRHSIVPSALPMVLVSRADDTVGGD